MKNKDIECILKGNFGDYLKDRLDERNMTMRKLSEKTTLPYGVLSKMTLSKGKPRNTKFQEFIVIMLILGDDFEDYIDYVLGRPKAYKKLRKVIKGLKPQELVLLIHILKRIPPDQITNFLKALDNLTVCFVETQEQKNDDK